MAGSECKSWKYYSDKERLVRIVLWKDYFILQLYLSLIFLSECIKVCFKLWTDLIIVYVELDSPYVHVVLEEFNLNLIFELTGSQQPCIVFLNPLGSKC